MVMGSRLDTRSRRDSVFGGSEAREGILRDCRDQGLQNVRGRSLRKMFKVRQERLDLELIVRMQVV